jgi:transcriptional regulator with XRE-family HTH domain
MSTRITQQQFADAIGVHFSMASRLLNGQRRPSPPTMDRIANAFHLDRDKLFDAYLAGRDADGRYVIATFLNDNIDFEPEEEASGTEEAQRIPEQPVAAEHHVGTLDLTGTGNE